MINIRELRIDNWVLSCTPNMEIMIPNLESKVQGITIFGTVEFDHSFDRQGFQMYPQHIAEIPITEKKLIDLLGAKKYNNIIFINDLISITVFNEINESSLLSFQDILIPVQYIHQVQNLVFDLTGI